MIITRRRSPRVLLSGHYGAQAFPKRVIAVNKRDADRSSAALRSLARIRARLGKRNQFPVRRPH